MGHDEEYIQQRIAAMLDWLITRSPGGRMNGWKPRLTILYGCATNVDGLHWQRSWKRTSMRKWHRKDSDQDYHRTVRFVLRHHLACGWEGGVTFTVDTQDGICLKRFPLEPYPRRGYAAARQFIRTYKQS